MKGRWKFKLIDNETKKVLVDDVVENDITFLGIGHVLDRALGRANVDPVNTTGSTWIAVGTGSATFTNWDSGLTAEVSGAGNLGRQKPDTAVTRSDYTTTISTTFGTGLGSGALTEFGIFVKGYASGNTLAHPGSGPNTGVLFNKVVRSSINKDSTNTLQIDIEVTNNVN